MEPGIPDANAKAVRLGVYNVDPAVRFWATPPIHGCLGPPSSIPPPSPSSCRPMSRSPKARWSSRSPIGMQAATRARIQPGDTAVVTGAGPIGIMVALAALAGGCSRVIVSDVKREKLAIAGAYANILPVDVASRRLGDVVAAETGGWGADIVFEASGAPPRLRRALRPRPPRRRRRARRHAGRAGADRHRRGAGQGAPDRDGLPLRQRLRPRPRPDRRRRRRPEAVDHRDLRIRRYDRRLRAGGGRPARRT